MSIKRIESAYAYFLDKKEMSGTQMAVLQALAYSANEKNHEKCYPSGATLAKMTHFSDRAVDHACQALRDMNVIDWVSGGQVDGINLANDYTFKFPLVKMKTRTERYEAIAAQRGMDRPPSTAADAPQYRTSCTTGGASPAEGVGHQVRTNTECKENINPQSNSESKGAPPTFDFGSVFKRANGGAVHDPRSANNSIDDVVHDRSVSPHYAALRVCGVDDIENKKTFNNYALAFYSLGKMDMMFDVIETFWGQIKQGEHDGLRNRAAELTKRLQARLDALKPTQTPT